MKLEENGVGAENPHPFVVHYPLVQRNFTFHLLSFSPTIIVICRKVTVSTTKIFAKSCILKEPRSKSCANKFTGHLSKEKGILCKWQRLNCAVCRREKWKEFWDCCNSQSSDSQQSLQFSLVTLSAIFKFSQSFLENNTRLWFFGEAVICVFKKSKSFKMLTKL